MGYSLWGRRVRHDWVSMWTDKPGCYSRVKIQSNCFLRWHISFKYSLPQPPTIKISIKLQSQRLYGVCPWNLWLLPGVHSAGCGDALRRGTNFSAERTTQRGMQRGCTVLATAGNICWWVEWMCCIKRHCPRVGNDRLTPFPQCCAGTKPDTWGTDPMEPGWKDLRIPDH